MRNKYDGKVIPALRRFDDHGDPDGCWDWLGNINSYGYGDLGPKRRHKTRMAHRLFYERYVGPIPEGTEIDHLCRNRACVNPAHLEPVTRRENLLRSPITLTSRKSAQTCCIRGHVFSVENTRIRSDGTRHCRECHRMLDRERRRSRSKVVV